VIARWVGLGGLIAALVAGRAAATVLDIAPDGRVTVIDGPTLQLSNDPIATRRIERVAVAHRPTARQRAANPRATVQVAAAIKSASQMAQLDASLIEAVAWQESRFQTDAVSPKGARGVMQLMPSTAHDLGVPPGDIDANVRGGAVYLRQLLAHYDGDLVQALAAYNAGPAAVDRRGGVPPYRETQAYVAAVLERMAERVSPVTPFPTRSKP
jgi:soluble lytic murein transglycosylase-like protein